MKWIIILMMLMNLGFVSSAIIMQDNFTGTTIDTANWDETDPNSRISQDDRLIYLNIPHSNFEQFVNQLKSDVSSSADTIVVSANMAWTDPGTNEAYGGVFLWKDVNNWAQIGSRSDGTAVGTYAFKSMVDGSETATNTMITQGKDIKMVYTSSTGNVGVFYWNVDEWTLIFNKTQNTGLTYNVIISQGDRTFFAHADIVYYDNLYFTDEDYATQYPLVADTCTCAGAGNNWEIDMSDYCNITEACDLTTGTLNFTGAGITRCDAVINTTNLGDPGATGLLSILDDCIIYVI